MSFRAHADDKRIPTLCADMAKEMGEGRYYPDLNKRMAQFELTLLDWLEAHRGSREYVVFANKCWPAFPSQFGFVPCYVNSRMASRGIPVACEVDIYGALSEYIGTCITGAAVTLLDINNSVPKSQYDSEIAGRSFAQGRSYALTDTFMGFHCGNTPSCRMHPDRAVKYQLIQHRTLEPAAAHRILHAVRWRATSPPAPSPYTGCSATARGAARVCRRGGGAARRDAELRRHRGLRHSGDGSLLPPCADRKAVSPPRRRCLRPLRQIPVRAASVPRIGDISYTGRNPCPTPPRIPSFNAALPC